MNTVGKRAEHSNPRHSFSAAAFRKVLKGFENGDLPYTEIKFQLKRLLATASPGELREVLRRSKLNDPLPEYAYREVQSLLNEAIEHNAGLQAEAVVAVDQEEELDPATLSAELFDTRSALEAEQTRAREAEEALSERIASEEAVRSRLDTTLRESERYQAELRAARNSLASRDKVSAQTRQILDERDAELAAIRRQHAELTAALESSAVSSEQLEADLQATRARQTLAERDAQLVALQRQHAETLASLKLSGDSAAQLQSELQNSRAQATSLTSDLAAARTALDSERHKSQGLERSLTDSNSLNGSVRESLASQERTLAEMRQMLSERDAQLVALQRQHLETVASLKLSGDSAAHLQSDLQNSRAQVTSLTSDLAAVRTALDSERRKSQGFERSLTDSNSLNGSVRESLASQEKTLAEMRQILVERNAQLAALQREHDAALASERRKNLKAMSDLEVRAQNLEDKLQAAKKRSDVLKEELKASHDAVAAVNSQLAKLQAKQRDGDALIEKLNASIRSEAKRATQWQAAAQQRQATAAVTAEGAPASTPLPELPRDVRAWRWNFRAVPRTVWAGAATLLLATAIWFVVHRSSPVADNPAASTAAVTQPDTTVPVPTVLPAGQAAGSGSGENAAAPEQPPHAATAVAARKPGAAKTDSPRCRNLDACYDAIRRRPSDPALLSALGDALLRANRPADALRTYQRLAILAPNMPGVAAKITATEAKISAKRATGKASAHTASQTQSH
jgi:septal ring factor EnvC (AmiA/AmiB activator)